VRIIHDQVKNLGDCLKLAWAKSIISAPESAVIIPEIKQIRYDLDGLNVCESFYSNGEIFWREHRKRVDDSCFLRHRDHNAGPALEVWYENGLIRSRSFYQNSGLHRPPEIGPAVIFYSESGYVIEEYWVDGERVPDFEIAGKCKR